MKVLLFGNSSSGKSTLAKELSITHNLAHLDLDTLAWLPSETPQRTPVAQANTDIKAFMHDHNKWVIEGCYTDLLECAVGYASELIFMDISIEQCIANAHQRPWEPHKYTSKEAQDNNLAMLVSWIEDYKNRQDTFSYKAHLDFYNTFTGTKICYINNQRNTG